MTDSLILMVMALVVFGPRRLPQIGRQLGKLMYEFRKASNDFKFQMEEELRNSEESDRRKKEEERLRAVAAAAPGTTEISTVPEVGPTSSVETQAPVPDGQFPTPSPYPGEEVYPPVIEPAPTEPVVTEPAAKELAAAPVQPVIQPPSTGEQVPAARPWNLEDELGKLSTPEAVPETPSVSSEKPAETPADESRPATEQAAHNG